jgi:hypothetical protein
MHLASGDIQVVRSRLPEGTEASVDATVLQMMKMAKGQYGARSAKIRALAINIINAAQVDDKDYYGYAEAIHNWVRDQIRYVHDPVGQETLSQAEETAFNSKAGDCDDKTILEIALLGSVGLAAWPVCIGVHQPGAYSHVYLRIQIPPGKHRYAGKIIPADPIMREWPLGKEAPADRVKAHKEFPQLAGSTMLDGYAEGPAYLDESSTLDAENKRRTALKKEVGNDPWAVAGRIYDGGDSMFAQQPATVLDLSRLGPMTQAAAQATHRPLNAAGAVRVVDGERPEQKGGVVVQKGNAPVKNGVQGIGGFFQGLSGETEVVALKQAQAEIIAAVKAREASFNAATEGLKQEVAQGSAMSAKKLQAMIEDEAQWRMATLRRLQEFDARIAQLGGGAVAEAMPDARPVAAPAPDPNAAPYPARPAYRQGQAMALEAPSKQLRPLLNKTVTALADAKRSDKPLLVTELQATADAIVDELNARTVVLMAAKTLKDLDSIAASATGAARARALRLVAEARQGAVTPGKALNGLGSISIVPTDSPKDDPSAPPVFRRRDDRGGYTSIL